MKLFKTILSVMTIATIMATGCNAIEKTTVTNTDTETTDDNNENQIKDGYKYISEYEEEKIDLDNYSPYPKNPKIAGFFKEIGLADELGSGIKKIAKYTSIYSGGKPIFKDDEIFKVTVPLIKNIENKSRYITSSKLKELILEFIVNSEGKTRQEINDYIYPLLNEELSSKNNRVRASLTYLKKKGFINNSGSDTKSLWKKV